MIRFLKRFFHKAPHPITFFGRTDTGKVRDHNEDSFCTLRHLRLFMVADGMGGHNAGEVASKLAIEALIDFFSEDRVNHMQGNEAEIRHNYITGFHHANKIVMEEAAADSKRHGMGCTLVSCFIDEGTLYTCHVGDARCYIAHNNKLRQITTDHTGVTYVSKSSDTGEETQRPRNVVTRAIGFPFPQDPEFHVTPLESGDKILLCSDGLWSMTDETTIEQILTNSETPDQASSKLVDAANAQGGRDNITALVIFH